MVDEEKRTQFKRRIYSYVLQLIRFLVKLPDDSVISEMKKQLVRSGTSIGANYFEALAASSKRDFQNYFSHSLKSANESKFWLAVIRDADLLSKENRTECESLLSETKQIANILAASILTMKGRTRSRS